MKEIKVGSGKKQDDGTFVHNVSFGNETFNDIPNIPKFKKCDSDNCKYYRQCKYDDGVVRTFDCKKNQKRVSILYSLFTTAIVVALFVLIFLTKSTPIFKGLGFLLLGLVGLDIICTYIEISTKKIRDKHFYNKLKKAQIVKDEKIKKEKEIEDAKRAEEEKELLSKLPYYQDVLKAEKFITTLKKLSDEYDFGKSNEKIAQCVNKLFEIIEILKKDSSGYTRVAFLFEGVIEEFYSALNKYTYFLKADFNDPENEKALELCVDKFLDFLNSQKVEAIFDKTATSIQFRSSVEALGNILDKN